MTGRSTLAATRAAPSPRTLTFKIASEDWEFAEVHKLNYETFVEEIPQHGPNANRTLVDKFHDENTYIICLRDRELRGMVAARGKRPFSLDQKLEDLDSYLPKGRSVCEIRLLAIGKEDRNGRILKGLLTQLAQYCVDQSYDLAIISGTVRQLGLYKRLGFVPFGPLVGTPEAQFQPMYGIPTKIKEEFKAHFTTLSTPTDAEAPVNLLPGPVGISRDVRDAFAGDPVSHRSPDFVEDFNSTKAALRALVGSRHAEILMGSGTLANDVIAGQLSLEQDQGLVLSNGEFGDRLVDHARRARLGFQTLSVSWGRAFKRDGVERALDEAPETSWIWAAHCETSSGFLNDMEMLKELSAERGIRLCMDCISSVGTVPIDLSGVYLASCVSGKGLGAFPGLSMVFYDHDVASAPLALPRYLDLGLLATKNGVPFTTSSNLLYALKTALRRFESDEVFDRIAGVSSRLRRMLGDMGFHIVAPDAHASPAVITIAIPEATNSTDVGRRLERMGYLLSYNSDYLRQRNWIQICLMGEYSDEMVTPLLDALDQFRPVSAPHSLS